MKSKPDELKIRPRRELTIREVNGRQYYTDKAQDGTPYIRVLSKSKLAGKTIPVELAGLAAGPDAWLRECQVECLGCNALKTVRELHSESDLPGHCHECATKYFTCDKCKGQHHPDDPC